LEFSGQDNLTCLGIAAQNREYRFAQELGLLVEKQFARLLRHISKQTQQELLGLRRIIVEKESHISSLLQGRLTPQKQEKFVMYQNWKLKEMEDKCARLSAENENLKVEHKEEIEKYKIEVDHLKKEAAGNLALKKDSSNKEKLLKADILNLNKCISRKKEKFADLSAKNEKLQKDSDRISNEASQIKKENENLIYLARREEDKLKRDADLQKVQFETIKKLRNENEELEKQLQGGNLGIFYRGSHNF
jgi:hypothetical protein